MVWLKNIFTRLIKAIKFFRNKNLSCYEIERLELLIDSLINDQYTDKKCIVIKSRYAQMLFNNHFKPPSHIEDLLGLGVENRTKQRIVSAATKLPDGTVIISVRHTDKYYHQLLQKLYPGDLYEQVIRGEEIQGFVDNKFNFLTREEALRVAIDRDQIIVKTHPTYQLFSEDIY